MRAAGTGPARLAAGPPSPRRYRWAPNHTGSSGPATGCRPVRWRLRPPSVRTCPPLAPLLRWRDPSDGRCEHATTCGKPRVAAPRECVGQPAEVAPEDQPACKSHVSTGRRPASASQICLDVRRRSAPRMSPWCKRCSRRDRCRDCRPSLSRSASTSTRRSLTAASRDTIAPAISGRKRGRWGGRRPPHRRRARRRRPRRPGQRAKIIPAPDLR